MKQLKLKAERRLFGKLDGNASETEKMSDALSSSSRRHLYSDTLEDFNFDSGTATANALGAVHRSNSLAGSFSPPPPMTTTALYEASRTAPAAEDNSSTSFSSSPPSSSSFTSGGVLQPEHQRHESMCNLLDYEEHIMKRDMTRKELALKGGDEDQLPVIALMLTTLRRSLLACSTIDEDPSSGMDISWPTNVRHVTHVTFDRFNGFLGLPVEFEVEIPKRAPSASANVFGVSPESMQCSYDSRGNSVPTILLRMQDRLYSLGGLKAEGIFRINAENSHEQHVREQLNKGIVPFNMDPHCLAGLIKAWFRELPTGVLDTLTPEQVMQCQTEEQSVQLVKLLPPMQAALLDWAVNLMADVAQEEDCNKMNARNVAMVFAPNMTQMADPLTALMHAVQVMNLLKTLILRAIKERQDVMLSAVPPPSGPHRSDGNESMNIVQLHERVEAAYDGGYYARKHVAAAAATPPAGGAAKAGGGRSSHRLMNSRMDRIERVEAW